MMRHVERPSPNHDARPDDGRVDILLMHYTGMQSCAAAVERLCDPEARVSSHYTVDEDGTIYVHVPEDRRAWHAGLSHWRGETNVNARSIGIEIVNPGHEFGYRAFPEAQIASVIELSRGIVARHPIPPRNVIAHSDVAPRRKSDPGELFPWARLAAAGLGIWPKAEASDADAIGPGAMREHIERLQRDLRAYGYGIETTGAFDAQTFDTVVAFQRHFRPGRLDGIADGETQALLAALLVQP